MTEIIRSKLADEIRYEKEYILRVRLSGGEVYSLFSIYNFQGGSSATRRSCFRHTVRKKGERNIVWVILKELARFGFLVSLLVAGGEGLWQVSKMLKQFS